MGRTYAVQEIAKAMAKRLRMREWRVDKATTKEELLHNVENIEGMLKAVRELLKESLLP